MNDASAVPTPPDVVDAGISTCPYCKERQEVPRRQWIKCDNDKCSRFFPAADWLFHGFDPVHIKTPGFVTPTESFTTALFALYLLHPTGYKKFPIRTVESEQHQRHACRICREEDLSGLKFHQLNVESKASPDLIIRSSQRLLHIENKPWADEGHRQIERYLQGAIEEGAAFRVLISCGNSHDALWNVLMEKKVPIILWEEVLLRMDRAKFGGYLAPGGEFQPYYETYVREP